MLQANNYKMHAMTKNSALSTFLLISIAVILTGIMLVIVTQIDQSQATYPNSVNFEQEQASIIEQVYQSHLNQDLSRAKDKQSVQERPVAPETTSSAIISHPDIPTAPKFDPSLNTQYERYPPRYMQTPQFDNAYEAWGNTTVQNDEPYYSLRNNPWSPDYRPGY